MDRHRLAEETSIALHREVAARASEDPQILTAARARVREWLERRTVHAHYAERWARLLDGPFDELARFLVDPSEDARALRQVSPFAGALDPQTRWAIWRGARADTSSDRT